MPKPDHELGRRGQKDAARLLRKAGYRIVTQNYFAPTGEIDIIARQKKNKRGETTLVFVEVKARLGRGDSDPEDAVTEAKQRHIIRAARHYIVAEKPADPVFRFDVVALVYGADGAILAHRHIEGAFEASD